VLLETPGANGKSVTINKPGWGTEVTGANTAPAAPRTWPKDRIRKMLKMAGSSPALIK